MSAVAQHRPVSIPAVPFAIRQHLRVVEGPSVLTSACERCALGAVCVPEGLALHERLEFTSLIFQHKRLQAGETLFRAGESFTHLYFVKTGSLKTVVLLDDGREQVTGFHFAGDVIGIDAISSTNHPSEAVALVDTHVCAIPFAQLTRLSRRVEYLQTWLQRLLAREVVRDQGLMLLLGRMHAEERVAAFLMNLSNRFRARGYSPHDFTLPMAREDIGNYLGLTLETVSRCFSRLKNTHVLGVDSRRIQILNIDALKGASSASERMEPQGEQKTRMAGK
ncbi:MAG: fumarate/nitrate reduction transcriptional regulator Fnr [Burkholderiales bacterium]